MYVPKTVIIPRLHTNVEYLPWLITFCVVTTIILIVLVIVIMICSTYYKRKKYSNEKHLNSNGQVSDGEVYAYTKEQRKVKKKSEKVKPKNSWKLCFKGENEVEEKEVSVVNHMSDSLIQGYDNKTVAVECGGINCGEGCGNGVNSEYGSSRLSCIDRELPPIPLSMNKELEMEEHSLRLPSSSSPINVPLASSPSPNQLSQKSFKVTSLSSDLNNDITNDGIKDELNRSLTDILPDHSIVEVNNFDCDHSNDDISSMTDFDPTYAMIRRYIEPGTDGNILSYDNNEAFLFICPICGADSGGVNDDYKRNSWFSMAASGSQVLPSQLTHNHHHHHHHNHYQQQEKEQEVLSNTTTIIDDIPGNDSTYASIVKLPKDENEALLTTKPATIKRQRSISQNDIICASKIPNESSVQNMMNQKHSFPDHNQMSETAVTKSRILTTKLSTESNTPDLEMISKPLTASIDLKQQKMVSTISIWSLRCSSCYSDSATNIYQTIPERKYGQSIVDMIERLRKSETSSGKENRSFDDDGSNRNSGSETPNFLFIPSNHMRQKHSGSSSGVFNRHNSSLLFHKVWSPPSCKMTHGSIIPMNLAGSVAGSGSNSSNNNSNYCSPICSPLKISASSDSYTDQQQQQQQQQQEQQQQQQQQDAQASVMSGSDSEGVSNLRGPSNLRPGPLGSIQRLVALNSLRKLSPLFHPVLTPPPLSPMDTSGKTKLIDENETTENTEIQFLSSEIEQKEETEMASSPMEKSYYEDLEYDKVIGLDSEVETINLVDKLQVSNGSDVEGDSGAVMVSEFEESKVLDFGSSRQQSLNRVRPVSIDLCSREESLTEKTGDKFTAINNSNNNLNTSISNSNSTTLSSLSHLPPSFQRLLSSEDSCAKSPLSMEPSPLTEENRNNISNNCFLNNQHSYLIDSSTYQKFVWSSSTNVNTAFIDEYETLE